MTNFGSKIIFVLMTLSLRTSTSRRHMYAQCISDLRDLDRFELSIAKNLTHILLATDKLPIGSEIRKLTHAYLLDFYQSTGFAEVKDVVGREETRASQYATCSYRLIRRGVFSLHDLTKHNSFQKLFGSLHEKIVSYFSKPGWPDGNDLKIAAEKILRIQHIYNLTTEDLGKGRISTVDTNCSFNYVHCMEIAEVALTNEKFVYAIEWLEVARDKASVENTSSVSVIEEALENAMEIHNNEFDEEIIMELEPFYFDRPVNKSNTKDARKLKDIQYEAYKGNRQSIYVDNNYLGLCSGDNFQTEAEKSHLFCWYEFKIHPTFQIGPAKMEFLARNPDIVQIYEILWDDEIQTIIKGSNEIQASGVAKSEFLPTKDRLKDIKTYHLEKRTSVVSWYVGSLAEHVSRKVELFTGLKVRSSASELLQVASYSFGGHYFHHPDETSFERDRPVDHYRIGTFMLYFNDINHGAGTAFTSVGVAAMPIKGSAVLWYNLFSDGSVDYMTTHGACPVLLGEKWAANKWIKMGAQFLTRKCDLQKKQRLQVPVNNRYLPIPMASRLNENYGY